MIDFQVVLIAGCLLLLSFLGGLVAILSDSLIRIRKRVDFLEEALKYNIIEYIKTMLE